MPAGYPFYYYEPWPTLLFIATFAFVILAVGLIILFFSKRFSKYQKSIISGEGVITDATLEPYFSKIQLVGHKICFTKRDGINYLSIGVIFRNGRKRRVLRYHFNFTSNPRNSVEVLDGYEVDKIFVDDSQTKIYRYSPLQLWLISALGGILLDASIYVAIVRFSTYLYGYHPEFATAYLFLALGVAIIPLTYFLFKILIKVFDKEVR